jgi:hypothetical protein
MRGSKSQYRLLSEVANDALDDVGEGMHRQYQFIRWAMKYAEELHVDFNRDIRTIRVNWKSWQAIELPSDCWDWILVGVQNGQDIMTFVKDDNIALYFDKDPNNNNQKLPNKQPTYLQDITQLPTMADYMFPYLNLTPWGEDPGKLYGLVVKDNGLGYFTENRNKDVSELQFSGPFLNINMDKPVYLMYLSTIWDPKEETLIHPFQAEYIVAGILKEYYHHSKTASIAQKEESKAEFERQTLKVMDRNWDLRLEDIYQWLFYQGYQMTPKIP